MGCYRRPAEAVSDSASNSGPQQSSVRVHESSSAEEEAAVHDDNAQPSLLPNGDKDHPVSVSSEEKEAASSPTQASEPSTEKAVVTVTSPEGDEELTREEASSPGLRGQEARLEETRTDDPEATKEKA